MFDYETTMTHAQETTRRMARSQAEQALTFQKQAMDWHITTLRTAEKQAQALLASNLGTLEKQAQTLAQTNVNGMEKQGQALFQASMTGAELVRDAWLSYHRAWVDALLPTGKATA